MTDFTTIMEANSKPPKTLRRPKDDPEYTTFLEKVREIRMGVLQGAKVCVVIETEQSFEEVFKNFTPAMKLYAKSGLITLKTIDKVDCYDLESVIVEL